MVEKDDEPHKEEDKDGGEKMKEMRERTQKRMKRD